VLFFVGIIIPYEVLIGNFHMFSLLIVNLSFIVPVLERKSRAAINQFWLFPPSENLVNVSYTLSFHPRLGRAYPIWGTGCFPPIESRLRANPLMSISTYETDNLSLRAYFDGCLWHLTSPMEFSTIHAPVELIASFSIGLPRML